MWITKTRVRLTTGIAVVVLMGACTHAFSAGEPATRINLDGRIDNMSAFALDGDDLMLHQQEGDRQGLKSLNLTTMKFRQIASTDFQHDAINLMAARDGVLVYVKSSFARTPRGYSQRSVDRLVVSDTSGRNRRIIHREFQLDDLGNGSRDCGREIADLRLLPRKRIQIVVTAYGRRGPWGRCSRSSWKFKKKRQNQRAIRFSYSGKRLFTRGFKVEGDLRHQNTGFGVSGNGRYLINPETSRYRVEDLDAGRTKFKPVGTPNREILAFPGFGRSAITLEKRSRRGSTFEFRFYRDFLRSTKYRRLGLVRDDLPSRPVLCGKRFLMAGETESDSIVALDADGRRTRFMNFPSDETFIEVICDERRVATLSADDDTGEQTFLRINPFKSVERP